MSARAGDALDVYVAERLVGTLEKRGSNRYRFTFDPAVASEEGDGAIVLSASLPVQTDAFSPSQSRPFFDGLLPEGAARRTLAQTHRIAEEDGFGLLAQFGRDVAGAVVLMPHGTPVTPLGGGAIAWLDEAELEQRVSDLPNHPLGIKPGTEGARLSLGGVQEKLILTRAPNGQLGQPRDGAPSTHILKPGNARHPDLAVNEAFCMKVARCAQLPTAAVEVLTHDSEPWLLVERFDRTLTGEAQIARIHQEDFCQAYGVMPGDKYEHSGGPGLKDVIGLLREISKVAALDVTVIVRATVLNVLLGNSDAHAKNYALLYDARGPRLAPLYDIVSTAVYDYVPDLAMGIGGEFDPARVNAASWNALAADAGLGGQILDEVERTKDRVLGCARAVAETAKAEGWHRPVIDQILETVEKRAATITA